VLQKRSLVHAADTLEKVGDAVIQAHIQNFYSVETRMNRLGSKLTMKTPRAGRI
jgi:hypothetical protein